jgi:hypothetical protein
MAVQVSCVGFGVRLLKTARKKRAGVPAIIGHEDMLAYRSGFVALVFFECVVLKSF